MKKSMFLQILVGIILITGMVQADSITLKDGSIYTGKIKLIEDDKLTIDTDFGTVTFPKGKIQNINYDSQKLSPQNSKGESQIMPDPYYIGIFGGLGSSVINEKNQAGVSQNGKYLNVNASLSIYFPIDNHFLIGAGISWNLGLGSFDTKTGNNDPGGSLSGFSLNFYHFDSIYYFNEICKGFFVKLSPGIGFIDYDYTDDSTSNNVSRSSDYSLGAKGGLGIAIEINHLSSAFIIGFDYLVLYNKFGKQDSLFKSGFIYLGLLW